MPNIIKRLYQRRAWDFTGIESVAHRKTLQHALDECDYPFYRIRKRTGQRVPCTVSDLSRFEGDLEIATGHGHVHTDEHGIEEHGHLLGEIAHRAALGLYWLPTALYPAGRVEIDLSCFKVPHLAEEVFLAEGAHAVDYGAMTSSQRVLVMSLFDYTGTTPRPEGWFEEQGEDDYWRWRGERWMGLFAAVYAPALPRPLELRQPWQWSYDGQDVAAVREIMR